MKKSIIATAITALFIYEGATAQTMIVRDTREDFVIGAKAGINGSNVWDEKGQSFTADPKAGFVAGGFVSIPLGKYLGIQPEVLYSQKGFKAQGTLLGSRYTMTRTTSHLDVPVLIQVKPAEFINIVGGPVYSYLLRQNDTYTWGDNAVLQEEEFANDNIRKNRMGLMFGADVVVAPFVIGGRAGWDLQDNAGDGSSSTPRYKNQWLQLTLGIQL